MAKKPVLLVIMDGWGIREAEEGNAVALGHTPNHDRWMHTLERAIIDTFGEHVGLVPGQMGNSEVGHLNLGAGRVVYQDISAIDQAIKDGSLAQDKHILDACARLKTNGGQLHLIGLLGPGGVHSHQSHLHALLDIATAQGLNPVVHVITDGRDTPPESGIGFLADLEAKMARIGSGRIATVSGRYYAMDRDKRWERTQRAWSAMVKREGKRYATAAEAIRDSYKEGVTDEFIVPAVIGEDDTLRVKPGDALLFYNFRADRMRQLVSAFALKDFARASHFAFIENLDIITMTVYEDDYPVKVIFGKEIIVNTLAEVISKAGLKQYHSAETEKYPHVTFFFNGRREDPWPGEERLIIPSPKVATYDLKPEMSAYELTAATLQRIENGDDDFILINFANPDMVGHTGSLSAAIKAVEVVDECVGQLVEAVLKKGGVAIVTADHGNCERMIDIKSGEPHTYHTVGPVSLWVIGEGYTELKTRGKLADVAPTVLHLMGLPKPAEMSGESLILYSDLLK